MVYAEVQRISVIAFLLHKLAPPAACLCLQGVESSVPVQCLDCNGVKPLLTVTSGIPKV
ncbi:hypothetical protein BFJ66_g16456 [Fusarium oxysporum f. sp. cepae]|nr:hypothetical protein BFJ66_g16456 [Fusarium oxysporum f. sp. cepae]RKK55046.1 hypothetical protein BFJ67_g4469 [Fusarium oxysporum f. sp. cepae]